VFLAQPDIINVLVALSEGDMTVAGVIPTAQTFRRVKNNSTGMVILICILKVLKHVNAPKKE